MSLDVGYRKLARAVFSAAVNDRQNAIHYLSRAESKQVEESYSSALQRKKKKTPGRRLPVAVKRELLADAQRLIKGRRQEAEWTITETTQFLVESSIWHEVLGVHPDAIRRRIEEADVDEIVDADVVAA